MSYDRSSTLPKTITGRPSSPLSPKPFDLQYTTMASSARRPHSSRSLSSARSAALKLPSLPRFHPANFPSSQASSYTTTPASGINSPQPPMSPRSQQRQYSDAQKQLYVYQREMLAAAGGKTYGKSASTRPDSPRLIPAGSPGPVTPLELENGAAGGYLMAGASPTASEAAQRDFVEKLIREEAARRGEISPKRATVGSY